MNQFWFFYVAMDGFNFAAGMAGNTPCFAGAVVDQAECNIVAAVIEYCHHRKITGSALTFQHVLLLSAHGQTTQA